MYRFSEQATSALPNTIGNAGIFRDSKPSPMNYLLQAKKYKDAQLQKEKAARDKKLDELYKYNPKAIFHPYEKQHESDYMGLLDEQTKLLMGGIDRTDPRWHEVERKKLGMEQNVYKGETIKKNISDAYAAAGRDPYTHKETALRFINDQFINEDGTYKRIEEVDPERIRDAANAPSALNTAKLTQDFVKTIPEKASQIVQQRAIAVGNTPGVYFNEIQEKSKFYQKDADGKLRINITPETKELFKQMDARVVPYIQEQLQKPENKGKTEDDIIRDLISPYAYVNRKVDASGITKEAKKGGSGDDDITVTDRFDVDDTFNLLNKGRDASKRVTASYSPHERRLGGKKADKPIYLTSTNFVDPQTNDWITDKNGDKIVGEQKVTINRLRLLPFDKETGQVLISDRETIKKAINNVVWKWTASGVLHTKDKDGKNVEKPVMLPNIDEIKTDLKEKLGVDMDNRDMSQITDQELATMIKEQYPNATPQERIQIFKQLKNTK
jgi:hypothetical protein